MIFVIGKFLYKWENVKILSYICNSSGMMDQIRDLSIQEPFKTLISYHPLMESTVVSLIISNKNVKNVIKFFQSFTDFQVPMEAVYIYDAVKLYALAVHEIMQSGQDPRNGTEVIQTIIKLGKYPSDIQGINVTIDENADSEGTSMLLAMVHHDECGSKFSKVGDFYKENDPEIPVRC